MGRYLFAESPYVRRVKGALWDLIYKRINPINEGFMLISYHFPKAHFLIPSPNTIRLGFQHMNFRVHSAYPPASSGAILHKLRIFAIGGERKMIKSR